MTNVRQTRSTPTSTQFKSVEPRLAPPSRGQHIGPVVLDVLHRRNSVIIRSKRPSGQAGPVLRCGRFENANLPHGASAARRSRRIARPVRRPCEAYVFVRPNAPGDDLPSPVFSATMPRGTSHGAARLLELELDQAGERRIRHASRAHSPRAPIALALFMPPASVGVCRERRRLRWSRCASRARATRRSCSASA